MPEGPEIETIRRGLEVGVAGQRIAAVDLLWAGSVRADEAVWRPALIGAEIVHAERRAKVLILELSSGYSILFHLKMTGQIVLVKADGERFAGGHPTESMVNELPDKSTRVVFELESGDRIYFNDQRKFGWIKVARMEDVEKDPLVAAIGPEVTSAAFTVEYLRERLARRGGSMIKPVIMDQSVAAGVGNIYADESLHLAKIHPMRRVASLSAAEVRRLHDAIVEIVRSGIEHGGTSFSNYVNALGGTGDYLAHARVFRREGRACPVCGTTIEKIRVAGRGTHFCSKCQKAPKE